MADAEARPQKSSRPSGGPLVELKIEMFRLGRGQNDRFGNWAGKAAQVRSERTRIGSALWRRFPGSMPGDPTDFREAVGPAPYQVTLTRVSPSAKGLDGHDNLRAAFKSCVDELAAWLGVDDGNPNQVVWRFEQERGEWAVKVRIEPACALGGCPTCTEQAAGKRGGRG